MSYALDPESIRAYRNRVMVFSNDLWREKDPDKRVTLVMYLADSVTTLARLEIEEARKLRETSVAEKLLNWKEEGRGKKAEGRRQKAEGRIITILIFPSIPNPDYLLPITHYQFDYNYEKKHEIIVQQK